jgi:hypothetical protein
VDAGNERAAQESEDASEVSKKPKPGQDPQGDLFGKEPEK